MQLLLLGQILGPIFDYGHSHWWVPVLYIKAMTLIATQTALSRPKYEYPKMFFHFFFGISFVPLAVTLFIVTFILRVKPWWEPQYSIPLAGMILNNALTGVSLGVNSLLTDLRDNSDRIEVLVAMGASRWEACRGVLSTAIVTANTPTINTLTVVGLVSIPGMMTGQIIGGNSPEAAAGYQLVAMFMILCANSFSVFVVCYLALCAVVSPDGRLSTDKISKRSSAFTWTRLLALLQGLKSNVAWSCRTCCGAFSEGEAERGSSSASAARGRVSRRGERQGVRRSGRRGVGVGVGDGGSEITQPLARGGEPLGIV